MGFRGSRVRIPPSRWVAEQWPSISYRIGGHSPFVELMACVCSAALREPPRHHTGSLFGTVVNDDESCDHRCSRVHISFANGALVTSLSRYSVKNRTCDESPADRPRFRHVTIVASFRTICAARGHRRRYDPARLRRALTVANMVQGGRISAVSEWAYNRRQRCAVRCGARSA